jgi:putative glycerol-1-phosphate prenyltransferase
MLHPLLSLLRSFRAENRKAWAVLIDPDKADAEQACALADEAERCGADLLLLGGSLVRDLRIRSLAPALKAASCLPLILFPGSPSQVVPEADGILFLSLISGRNPDLLIGRHVEAAPLLRQTGIEVLPTGYLLFDSGRLTTVHYLSQSLPLPYDKPDLAAYTALAGEMLGLQVIYLDGGSGAQRPASSEMVQALRRELSVPLLVGGGIRSAEEGQRIWAAGADVIVTGTATEQAERGWMEELGRRKREMQPPGA